MKIYGFLFALITSLILISCNTATEADKARTEHEHLNKSVHSTGPEYTSNYVCPMHCKGSGSDTMGICPVCKMDYVKNVEE